METMQACAELMTKKQCAAVTEHVSRFLHIPPPIQQFAHLFSRNLFGLDTHLETKVVEKSLTIPPFILLYFQWIPSFSFQLCTLYKNLFKRIWVVAFQNNNSFYHNQSVWNIPGMPY
mmetsp:Transcript_1345/g.4652  ORF Transcript_1345/g.4652 Transcript_1345/m.4652 type:complete len:117 (+) Transcript_1345:4503-4853(+)